MTRPEASSPERPAVSRGAPWALLVGAALALALILLLGREIAVWRARRGASRCLDAGAVASAQRWLAWAARLAPNDQRIALLRAACFRELGQEAPWRAAIEEAEQKGGRAQPVRLEHRLGQFQWGLADRIESRDFGALTAAGAVPREAATAVVQGLLAKGDLAGAERALDAWTPDPADQPHAAYLRGICFWTRQERESAQAEFQKTLDRLPEHEMARAHLGRVLEQQDLLKQALEHYARVAAAAPQRESAQVDLARVLRKLGRLEDARRVLPTPASPRGVSQAVALELAEREYETGDYDQAQRWFKQIDLEGAHPAETLRTAAAALALAGDGAGAQRLFARVDQAQGHSRQLGELRRRLTLDPGDPAAAAELQHLMESPSAAHTPSRVEESSEHNSPLYREHCAACHGIGGEGRGRAARNLYPRPRDLRQERYRLVSTLNGVPRPEDIERVIRRGIPGTSMPAFPYLSNEQCAELVQQVLRFQREGARQRAIAQLEAAGEAADQEDLQRIGASLATPGLPLPIPDLGSADAPAVARGRTLYLELGCKTCHGPEGSGPAEVALFDERGRPTPPRDLVRDPMKGGPEPESLYRRIRLGMPGTPHPAAATLSEEDLTALVHYCRSLGQEPKRILTNHQRELRAAQAARGN